jgi:hypothetical protein
MRHVAILLGFFLAAPVGAQAEGRFHRVQEPGHSPLDCYCRAQGRMFAPGEKVCLKTPDGPRLAQCRMETNVMSWSVTEVPCPDA